MYAGPVVRTLVHGAQSIALPKCLSLHSVASQICVSLPVSGCLHHHLIPQMFTMFLCILCTCTRHNCKWSVPDKTMCGHRLDRSMV